MSDFTAEVLAWTMIGVGLVGWVAVLLMAFCQTL